MQVLLSPVKSEDRRKGNTSVQVTKRLDTIQFILQLQNVRTLKLTALSAEPEAPLEEPDGPHNGYNIPVAIPISVEHSGDALLVLSAV